MIGEGDCGAIGGMKIGRGNRSTRRKPAPAPLCPPQIPLDQTRDRTLILSWFYIRSVYYSHRISLNKHYKHES
jgi:hypothetical protein